jgi:hypothetical protein
MGLTLRGLGDGAQCWLVVGVVAHLAALDRQIALVVLVLAHPVGDALEDVDPLLAQARLLERVVGHESDRLHVEVGEDLGGEVVAAGVGLEAELLVGLDRVGAAVL